MEAAAAVETNGTDVERKRLPSEADSIPAKKQKTGEVDLQALRKQIEYYFSDENLARDAFFHNKISSHAEGWMDMKFVLSCKKIQALHATREDILAALNDSSLETKVDHEDVAWIRRTDPLPPLSAEKKPHSRNKKEEKKAGSLPKVISAIHTLGYWLKVTGVPEEASWAKIKEALSEALKPEQGKIRQVSTPNSKGESYIYMRKFPNDEELLSKITQITINGVDVGVEIIRDLETARQAIESLPPSIARDREREFSKLKAERASKPLLVGGTRFESMEHLKKCCRELLDATPEGTSLKPSAFEVVRTILKYHPKTDEKTKDLVGIKVALREDLPQDSKTGKFPKCFFVERSDGSTECLELMMQDPPLADSAATSRQPDGTSNNNVPCSEQTVTEDLEHPTVENGEAQV